MTSYKNNYFKAILTLLFCVGLTNVTFAQKNKPMNFLIVTADDMNWDSPNCYGNTIPNLTPNIDKLAKEGIQFMNGHVAAAACYPSRSAISTGRIPHRSGGEGFKYLRYANIPTVQQIFHDNGYKVGITGKVHHSTPYEDTPWDFAEELHRDTEVFYEMSKKFIEECEAENKPFYYIVNSHDPHRPYYNIDDEGIEFKIRKGIKEKICHPSKVVKKEELNVPISMPDTDPIRKELADYFSSVSRFDDVLGRIMDLVEEKGLEENTFIVFLSDHGMANPGAKANVYMQSTRVPFIIKWPEHITPGTVDNENFISAVDLLPTLIDIAGFESPGEFDGKSLVPLLEKGADEGRDHLETQFYLTSGRSSLFMRASQDKKYIYVYNGWYSGKNTYWSSSMGGSIAPGIFEAAKTDEAWKNRFDFLLQRSPEEFYDLESDPLCLNNLINNEELKDTIDIYRQRTYNRMKSTDDMLLSTFEVYKKTHDPKKMYAEFLKMHQTAEESFYGKAPKEVDLGRFSGNKKKKKKKKKK